MVFLQAGLTVPQKEIQLSPCFCRAPLGRPTAAGPDLCTTGAAPRFVNYKVFVVLFFRSARLLRKGSWSRGTWEGFPEQQALKCEPEG